MKNKFFRVLLAVLRYHVTYSNPGTDEEPNGLLRPARSIIQAGNLDFGRQS
jgi:hypothetical protein